MTNKENNNNFYNNYLTLKRLGVDKLEKPKPIIDLEQQKRRARILKIVENRFKEKSLKDRLLWLDNTEPQIFHIINEGLLGFLPDDTLLKDIYPQGEGSLMTDTITNDVLWKSISDLLNPNQKKNTHLTFRTLRKITQKLQDPNNSLTISKNLIPDNLKTLTGIRAVGLDVWNSIAGFGDKRAEIIYNGFKKIN